MNELGVDRGLMRGAAERELELRLLAVGTGDTVLGMLFRSVLEAVRALRGEEVMEECLEEGLRGRPFVDFFAYPAEDFLRMLRRAAWAMGGASGGFEESMRMLGHLGTAAFLRSPAGRAMDVVISGTPRRVVEHLPTSYRVTTPTGGALSVVWWGMTGARVLFARDVLPRSYVEGSLEAQLKKAGARGVRISGRMLGPLSSEFELSWAAE